MKRAISGIFVMAAALMAQPRDISKIVPPLEESGFQSMFDGKTFGGWDCDTDFWRVEGGAIVGESKLDHQPPQNIFCIWKGGQPGDSVKAEGRDEEDEDQGDG